MNPTVTSSKKGFTMVELLLVVAIIGMLISIVISAINPRRQLAQARDAQRKSDVLTIMGAYYQYILDKGSPPANIPYGLESAEAVCKSSAPSCNNGVNLRGLTGAYLAEIPFDPNENLTSTGTNYYIYAHEANRITVYAPGSEIEKGIQATR